MASSYQQPITMYKALTEIEERNFLLPAIQREFVWSHIQICKFFDSMMRGYPINTFMLWSVTDKEVKDKFKYYEIMREYCEDYNDTTSEYTNLGSDFKAIIDGQQRLTAINIGLHGTYAYKLPYKRRHGIQNEVYPPRKLYLELTKKLNLHLENNEEKMEYNFEFLTEKEVESKNKKGGYWYEVRKILAYKDFSTQAKAITELSKFVEKEKIQNPEVALDMLISLYSIVFVEQIIHYYLEESQDTERVLDVFIRTNSGGTQLSYSDLLMSIAVDSWSGDARRQIDGLIKEIKNIGFRINRDLVLKACLMLTDNNVQFKIRNFNEKAVSSIVEQWDHIEKCLFETFTFIRSLGINDDSLQAKNAVIPIAYYFYYNDHEQGRERLYNRVNRPNFSENERAIIKKWLVVSLLKQFYGGQPDSSLTALRKLIKSNNELGHFPFEQIRTHFKSKTKNINIDDDFIEGLMMIQKHDPKCRLLLSIIFSDLDFSKSLEIDHLHPKVSFSETKLKELSLFDDKDLYEFYKDRKHWNAIPNLHLLYESDNRSKSKTPLAEWFDKNQPINKRDLLIPEVAELEFEKFKEFYEARKELLKNKISEMLK